MNTRVYRKSHITFSKLNNFLLYKHCVSRREVDIYLLTYLLTMHTQLNATKLGLMPRSQRTRTWRRIASTHPHLAIIWILLSRRLDALDVNGHYL